MAKRGRPVGSTTKRMTNVEMNKFISESVRRILNEHMSWTEYTTWAKKNGLSPSRANEYWKKAWEAITERFDIDRNKQIAKHLQKYWNIHDGAIERGDLNTARQALNDIAKMMGLNEPEKVDMTNEITFNFGDE